ncbi:redoxin domain-containing protein [Paenibacillus tuaregi]|uniref:redoxin domain-containing protein n=1 Tax=Paenibacillus tuaregi TaxID=1816681 RepID=UPI0008398355|nr:redoxin domain-containing protein [Paenibacillus tuaregi]
MLNGSGLIARRVITLVIGVAAIAGVLYSVSHFLNKAGSEQDKVRLGLGEKAPDFEAVNSLGNKVRLSDSEGQVVLLNIWASWCKPCVKEMPLIQQVIDKDKNKTEAWFINAGEAKGTVTQFLKSHEFQFPVIIDVTGRISSLYEAHSLPVTYIINRSGRISRIIPGEIEDAARLQAWLDEAGSRSTRP